jgi:RNA polymerase sigma-70 factor (ECF subfamily)
MAERTIDRARAGSDEAFRELTEPYRRELLLHCYRMLGSLQDAEDQLQETLLAAWRAIDGFEERASMRTWLYRIATNRCLNALRDGARRPGRAEPPGHWPPPTSSDEPAWLEPVPDRLLEGIPDGAPGPDARYEAREAVGLAFVTALARLPARQRAVLVLRDVLALPAAEVAEMLDAGEASVNSALARARAALEQRLAPGWRERAPAPRSALERGLVERFAAAFERGDVEAVAAMLTDDALLTMPPEPFAYAGPAAIAGFLEGPGGLRSRPYRLVATRANGQPAFGCYVPDPQAPIRRARGMLVLTLRGERICALTRFLDDDVLARFGLPGTIDA